VAAKHLLSEGELASITLSEAVGEQLIKQYADGVNFMIKEEERYFRRLALLLEQYGLASSLLINWPQSLVYWLSPEPDPPWISNIDCPWAIEHQLSKFLGSPFGIDVKTSDVDEF